MINTMLSGESIPTRLGLYNLGFTAEEGAEILEKLVTNE